MSAVLAVVTAVALSLVGLALPAAAAGDTWYVDQANGTGGPDCGQTAATACTTVDAALQQAADTDIISIEPGEYFDTLAITKSVTLQGTSRTGVVIHAAETDDASTLSIGDTSPVAVTLSTMTVQSDLFGHPAVLAHSASAVTMSDVTVTPRPDDRAEPAPGVLVDGGSTATITDSAITGNSGYGVGASNGSTATLDNTTVKGNGSGVQLGVAGSETGPPSTVTITDSDITENTLGVAVSVGTVTIKGGTLADNKGPGLTVALDGVADVTGTSITGNNLGFAAPSTAASSSRMGWSPRVV